MKKTTLIIGLIFIINHSLKSQDYVPFPTENVYWNVYLEYSISESPTDSVLLRYALQGDTIINQITYKKLCIESGDVLNPMIEPVGALREEERKIFFLGKDYLGFFHDEEILLYDFNKEIGDTIFHDINKTSYSVVENIDAIEIAGVDRKRFKIKSNTNYYFQDEEYWIEGIGSIKNGLLGHITMIPTCCYHYWEHICCQVNGEVLFLNPSYDECFPCSLLSSNALQWSGTKIKIYPNPTSEKIYIENNTSERELFITMYDINGRIRLSTKLSEQNNINVLQLEKGVYVVKVTDQNGEVLATARIVKQ
jgi:hypothetical protein